MDNHLLRSYLLGTANAQVTEEIEHTLLGDDTAYEQLLAIEDELIEEYVGRRLSAHEEARFVEYLHRLPDGAEKVQFARTLERCIERRSAGEERTPFGRLRRGEWQRLRRRLVTALPAAAALAAVCVATVWTLSMMGAMHRTSEEARKLLAGLERSLSEEQARNEELTQSLEDASRERLRLKGELASASNERDVSAAPSSPPWFQLNAGTLRTTTTTQVVRFPLNAPLIELRLDLGLAAHATYEAVLVDADGTDLMMIRRLVNVEMGEQWLVPVPIPTRLLKPGDYYVSLMGTAHDGAREPLARYAFRIPRQ